MILNALEWISKRPAYIGFEGKMPVAMQFPLGLGSHQIARRPKWTAAHPLFLRLAVGVGICPTLTS